MILPHTFEGGVLLKRIGNTMISIFIALVMLMNIIPSIISNPSILNRNNMDHSSSLKYAEYFFDEGGQSYAIDDSGRLNDGQINNCIWTNGRYFSNNALSFSRALNSYVDIPNSPDFNYFFSDSFTIYGNIKLGMFPSQKEPIVSHLDYQFSIGVGVLYKGYDLYIDNGYLSFEVYDWVLGRDPYPIRSFKITDSKSNLFDGEWHFIAVVYSNNIYSLYIDPSRNHDGLVQKAFSDVKPADHTNHVFIGRSLQKNPSGNYDYFDGVIDDLHFHTLDNFIPWKYLDTGYYTFDENTYLNSTSKFINDRATNGHEDRGYMYCGFSSNRIYGTSSAVFINGEGLRLTYAQVPDFDSSLDLNTENFYIDFWFLFTDAATHHHTFLYKVDTSPLNGYHLYLDYFNDPETQKRFGKIIFKTWNEGQLDTLMSNDYIVCQDKWYHLIIKLESGVRRMFIEDSTNSVIYNYHDNVQAYPGPTDNDLFIGNKDPSQIPTWSLRWGLDGNMDELILGEIQPRNTWISFDQGDLEGTEAYDLSIGPGIYESPRLIGNTPWGKTYDFDGSRDMIGVDFIPFQCPIDESFVIEVSVFPYRYKDVEHVENFETYSPSKRMILQYGFWSLFINEDEKISFLVKSKIGENCEYYEAISLSKVKYFQWNQIKVLYNYDNVKLYINGIYQCSVSIEFGDPFTYYPDPRNQNRMNIGNGIVPGSEENSGFFGYIDELLYHNIITYDQNELLLRTRSDSRLLLDLDEGEGYLTYDNSPFDNNGILGKYYVNRADNDGQSQSDNYKIINDDGDFGKSENSWIDNTCTVSICGGTNKGNSRNIESKGNDYISVGSNNPFPDNNDGSTVYYIQKNNPSWVENGIYGRCLDFSNDANSYEWIKIDDDENYNSLDFSNEISISCWVKPENTYHSYIIGKWNGVPGSDGAGNQLGQFWVEFSNYRLKIFLCEKDINNPNYGISRVFTSNNIFIQDMWYKIQVIYHYGDLYIFSNGIMDRYCNTDISELFNKEFTNDDIYVGGVPGLSYGMNGYMDQVELFADTIDYGIPVQYFDFETVSSTTISDESIQPSDGSNCGATQVNGKYGKGLSFDGINDYIRGEIDCYNTYTVEAWIKTDHPSTQTVSVYPYQDDTDIVYPSIFQIMSDGRLALYTTPTDVIYSYSSIQWNIWNHIAYTVRILGYDNSNDGISFPSSNSVTFYINGMWDSTYYDLEFRPNDPNPSLSRHTYILGKCPSSLWGSSFSSNYYNGLMDEFIITNSAKNFRTDLDGDGMSDGYEISRSQNSNQYNQQEHNYRTAILFAPNFDNEDEKQYVYDITMMRHHMRSLGWKDEDILFLALKQGEGTFYETWMAGDWIYGEPRRDSVDYAFDALEFGGPADLYYTDSEGEIVHQFYCTPKLTERDTLFTEFRDHGVGYKDSPAVNGEGYCQETLYGWRGGRCQSVNKIGENQYSGEEEETTAGDIHEKDFEINLMWYFSGLNTVTLQDGDPDFFYDENTFKISGGACYRIPGTNPPEYTASFQRMRWTLDLDGNEYKEEIYLVGKYDENQIEHWPNMDGACFKQPTEYWFRLYIDGYDFDQVVVQNGIAVSGYGSTDTDSDGRDTMWDAEVLAFKLNDLTWDWQGTSERLMMKGLDLNQDEIIPPTYTADHFESYDSGLNDYIDIDEGIVCLHVPENPPEEIQEGSSTDELAQQFDMKEIIWDDDLNDELDDISVKYLLCLVDCCFSGGFINDLDQTASLIMTSNRENDTSHRYNVMFYSRVKGNNTANGYRNGVINYEDRSNRPPPYDDDRYWGKYITADGARDLNINPTNSLDQNNDRDIKWDTLTYFSSVIGIQNNIISMNEAMIFTDAILADANDLVGTNQKVYTNRWYWMHDPEIYMIDDSNIQLFI